MAFATDRKWLGRFDVSDLFHQGIPPDELGQRMQVRLGRGRWSDDEDLADIIDELGDIADVQHFDMVWDAFYDWADACRVWVLPRP